MYDGEVPSSQLYQIPKIVDCIVATNPQSVLDVGVGFGKYGFLAREYLEVWDHDKPYGTFTRRIDGIEIFPEYLTPLHSYIYDEIFAGDASELAPALQRSYDLVLLIDVLEHFHREVGRALLETLLARNSAVLVSVPRDLGEQEEVFANEHETHHDTWTLADLKTLSPLLSFGDRTSVIALLAPRSHLREVRVRLLKRRVWRATSWSPRLSAVVRSVSRWRQGKNGLRRPIRHG
ncbi:MAG TPA: class I SAM-dependent methyltransferase [Acidimicrobiales bacterium]|nr:class I SAM-dependent methyltransferase [Acidimicrobiales bacterium]